MKKIGKKLSEVKVSRRSFLKGAVAGTAALGTGSFLTRVVAHAQEKEPIVIGVLSPLSGLYGDLGYCERLGIEMAINEFNAKGGVLGRKVEMAIEDTQTNPMIASRKASRLIKREKVNFLIGEVSSGAAMAIAEVSQNEGVIYVATNANSDALTDEKCHRYCFRVPASMTMFARGLAPYVFDNMGKKWYFLTHDYTSGHTGRDAMKKVLEAKGGQYLGETLIPIGTSDYSSQILKIKQINPEVLIVNVWGSDGNNFYKQFSEFGLTNVIKATSILYNWSEIWAMGPGLYTGVTCIEWYHYTNVPGAADFIQRFKKTFPTAPIPIPENNCFMGYVGMKALLLAVEKAKTVDSKAVVKAMEGLRYNEPANGSDVYIREWDHQFMLDYYMVRAKKPNEMKDRTDFFEVVNKPWGEKYAKTKAETPCKLEPL